MDIRLCIVTSAGQGNDLAVVSEMTAQEVPVHFVERSPGTFAQTSST